MFLRTMVERLLGIDQASKPQVYMGIVEAADLGNLNYWLELAFSAGIATLGLVLNSPAVVIGAMLISPLIGPIIGAGLALAAADFYLGIRSCLNLLASVAAAILISALLVWLLPLHTPTGEILARTRPNLLDLGVALLSGFAGSLLVFRRGGSGSSALPGVAIAVALMPPLCASGFGLGSGPNWPVIAGAGLLFLTNLAAIVASAFLVFLAARMDAPDVRMKIDYLLMERASGDRLYQVINRTAFSRVLGDIGKLRWRVLMLVAVLAILYAPLKKALVQVREETVARGAVNDAIRHLAAQEDLVGQQVSLGSGEDEIQVSLLVTRNLASAKVREAERLIVRRTGRNAHISVRQIADQAEIARLREGLQGPASPPAPQSLDNIRDDVVRRLDGAMKEVWPADLPLKGYEMGFAQDAIAVRIRFEGPEALPAMAQDILARSLQSRLGLSSLRLIVENTPPQDKVPPKPPRRK